MANPNPKPTPPPSRPVPPPRGPVQVQPVNPRPKFDRLDLDPGPDGPRPGEGPGASVS